MTEQIVAITKLDSKGYVLIYLPDHFYSMPKRDGFILEHRAVVENFIKRRLEPGWCVHHLNEDKTDNRIENLMIFKSNKEHSSWHNKLKRYGYLTNPMKEIIRRRWEEFL